MLEFFSIAITMGLLRLLSGMIEISAGLLMIYFQNVETALKINATLALIGPTIMIVVTSLGLIGIAGNVSLEKMLTILCGVALIFYGINKM
ncbi:MAG: YqhV family protein [Peptococcia bacterium]